SAILRRRFPPGARMPATRRLAAHLGVARITVALAYQELVADGYLITKPRSGVFVSNDPPGLMPAPKPVSVGAVDWEARLGPLLGERARVRKPEDWRSYAYPFVYGQTDESLFPHDSWRDCARRALGRREFPEVAADASTRDDPRLVACTLSHSLPSRGVEAGQEELLITLGAQNALWLAAETLGRGLGRPLRVAVEDPCYPELRDILRLSGAETHPAPVDSEGLDPEALPLGVDLVCVAPSHQAPTGASLSERRRKALLARASAEEFLILEDDYDFEMSFLRPPSPALKTFDIEGRVLYVGSYSKPLFPGLRLGYLVGPEPFIRAARALRSAAMRHPPGMTQRTVAHFLAFGHYNAHVARMKRAFAERRAAMQAALLTHGFSLPPMGGHGGASFWASAPADLDSEVLARRARRRGVLIEPGAAFYAAPRVTPLFRIAYSSASLAQIAPGVALLAEAAQEA
ncbi:MAG: PLP-dependent aminotransferase family protein, partial [Pseudomonadota bacterium]